MRLLNEHDRVVLTTDVPNDKLAAGDVGAIMHVHGENRAYEVEFVALDGESIAIVTLDRSQVRAVEHREITQARRLV